MIKGYSNLMKFKVVILSVVCLAVTIAWPGWRAELRAQGGYGYGTDTGYGYGYGYDSTDTSTTTGTETSDTTTDPTVPTTTTTDTGTSTCSCTDTATDTGADGCDVTPCDPCRRTIPCGPDTGDDSAKQFEADIDVIPCVSPNVIKAGARGLVTVILKGSKDLDIRKVDTGSIAFAGAKPVKFFIKHVTCRCEKRDFKKDMILIFKRCDLALTTGDIEVTLTGKTLTGAQFTGKDSVKVVDCQK